MRTTLTATAALMLAFSGCTAQAERTPSHAQLDDPLLLSALMQMPRGAPSSPWFGQGHIDLTDGSVRLTGTAVLRGMGHNTLRLELLDEHGVEQLDAQMNDAGSVDGAFTIHAANADLRPLLPHLLWLIAQAYTTPMEDRVATSDRVIGRSTNAERVYAGDPLLLRQARGDGMTLNVGDYRLIGDELIAHTLHASGALTLTLTLEQAKLIVPAAAE